MKKNSVLIILGTLFSLNLLAWIAVWDLRTQELEVMFFDVGQGDSIFIETPERVQILIDGGPSSAILEKLGREMPFWDRTIDLIVLTHPEHDHIAGLLEVLKRYRVKNILWTGIVRDTEEYKEWQKLIEQEGANVHIARTDLRIYAGESWFVVLYPFEDLQDKQVKNTNNSSIVIRLSYGGTSFLFTGDAPKSVESQLISLAEQEIDVDVLKAGHHGSKTSTSKEFVQAVSPEIAVISSGKDNKYGHPHQEVLDNLAGIQVLRTDLRGDIKIISNGLNYQF